MQEDWKRPPTSDTFVSVREQLCEKHYISSSQITLETVQISSNMTRLPAQN